MKQGLLIPLCLVAMGCATTHLQRLERDVRAARAPDTMMVLEEPPQQPYQVIARVDAKTGAVFQGFDDLRAKIIDQAAQLGGDGVILGHESKERQLLILTTGLIPTETKRLSGEVFVFR